MHGIIRFIMRKISIIQSQIAKEDSYLFDSTHTIENEKYYNRDPPLSHPILPLEVSAKYTSIFFLGIVANIIMSLNPDSLFSSHSKISGTHFRPR